jgi:hypothetical protein
MERGRLARNMEAWNMCPHEEKVTAWLLGDLSPEERQAMTRHLEVCAECRAARDECAGVLAPLQSGLAKDGAAAVGSRQWQSAVAVGVRRPENRWPEWLRRAALLALSLGTLGVLLAVAQWRAGRGRGEEGAVTHITFLKGDGGGAPALDALPEVEEQPPSLAGFPPGRLLEADPEVAGAGTGAPPVAAGQPRLPGLLTPGELERANKAVAQARPAADAPKRPAAEKAEKTERRGGDGRETADPPAYPQVKPVALAGAAPAPAADTNRVAATNAPAAQDVLRNR